MDGGAGEGDVDCNRMRRERSLVGIVNPLIFELQEGLEREDYGGGELMEVSDELEAGEMG